MAREGGFISRDDRAGEGRGDHEEQQPGHTRLVGLEDADLKVGLVGRDDGGHLLDILGGLLLHDVDDVVDGDDADHTILVVHDGHGGEIVFLEHLGRFFLVGQRVDADDVVVHDLADDLVIIFEKQVAKGHGAAEHALIVDDIADVDGLRVEADAADTLDRVLDGHGLAEIHVLDRHDRAGGVLRIAEQVVDVRPGLGACIS